MGLADQVRAWHRIAVVASLACGGAVGAQSVERPVPFDTAGRVLTITPRFVERFKVGSPWTVIGSWVEARLYARSEGGFVLVVQRPDGALERTLLDASQRLALSDALGTGLATAGGVATIGEGANILSEPAGSAFTRNMTIAGATVWGPSLAAMVGDSPGAAAAYLATVGAAFFTSSGIAGRAEISRAQNHLATDGTARGAAIGEGLAYLIDARNNDAGRSALRLAGSVVLATTGFVAGRPLSDGEAHGATWGSTYAGAVSAGVIGLAGGWSSGGNKGEVAATVGAALLGYPFGLHWVRRSRYAITSGDVSAIRTAALLGTAAAASALDSDANDRLVAGLLTSGFVLGSGVGAAAVARKFDLTESQANQVNLGTIAGGLTGLVLPTLAQARDGRAFFLAGAIGGAIGMAVTLNMVDPRPGAGRRVSTSRRVRFTPLGVLGLAGGRPAGDPGLRRATVFRVSF